jgi:hypothetical protein
MDSIEALLASGGWLVVLVVVVSVVVAIVVVAMPFLVWGTHTMVQDLSTRLWSIESNLSTKLAQVGADTSSAPMELLVALSKLDAIEQRLDAMAAEPRSVDRLRADALDAFAEQQRMINSLNGRVDDVEVRLGAVE